MSSAITNIKNEGPWKGVDHNDIRDKFVTHTLSSPYPEQFRGIAQDVKPPLNRDFHIIKKHVSIDPTRRGNDLAPCNLCGPKPKFKNDGMLILDDFGWLYLIGPICGEEHYEERFHDEERRFDRDEAKRQAFEYLLNSASQIFRWHQAASSLRPFATAASETHLRLQNVSSLVRELRQALTKQDGWLRVDEERQVLQANGNYRTERHPVNVIRITGMEAVRTGCKLPSRLDEAIAILEAFGTDEDEAINHIAVAEKVDRLPEIAAELRRAIATTMWARKEIEGFQAFFSVHNYRAIAAWADDVRNPIRFNVIYNGPTRTLDPISARNKYPIDISVLCQPLPETPSENSPKVNQIQRRPLR